MFFSFVLFSLLYIGDGVTLVYLLFHLAKHLSAIGNSTSFSIFTVAFILSFYTLSGVIDDCLL